MPAPGGHLALPGVAVAHHQVLAGGVCLVSMGIEVGTALSQQGYLQHLLGGQPAQLVQADSSRHVVFHPLGLMMY
jgi:hypothetical protein